MFLLAAAAVIAAPQTATLPTQPASAKCPRTTAQYARQRGKSVKPQKLTELPDANLYLTVYRRIDGCESPIIVKYGVSGR